MDRGLKPEFLALRAIRYLGSEYIVTLHIINNNIIILSRISRLLNSRSHFRTRDERSYLVQYKVNNTYIRHHCEVQFSGIKISGQYCGLNSQPVLQQYSGTVQQYLKTSKLGANN